MIREIVARHLHRHIDQSLILPPRVDTSYVSRGARNESESAERERERERPPYPRLLAGSFGRIAEYRQLRARGIASGSRRHRTRRYSATCYSPAPNRGKAVPRSPSPLPLLSYPCESSIEVRGGRSHGTGRSASVDARLDDSIRRWMTPGRLRPQTAWAEGRSSSRVPLPSSSPWPSSEKRVSLSGDSNCRSRSANLSKSPRLSRSRVQQL